ncbi:hypothetical protein [Actinoplanes sp. NPDC089786]|uniref:hypothetical protein n=1 Tax=Actinoplanes sp. NPDC089786 TaxID=3155185 RepID=UPI00341CBB78
MSIRQPFTQVRELPPYVGILAVDAKGFTEQPGAVMQEFSGLIPELVGRAFERVGLHEEWQNPPFFGPTGDGFAVGIPTAFVPRVIHPFLGELQRVLAEYNQKARLSEPQIRLRASLNVGPVSTGTNPYVSGNGTARNETHRLLDSIPVRAILSSASPRVTFVAAILSDRVFQDVVVGGYAQRHPDHFLEVNAAVEGKAFGQRAWLHVPEPSGNLVAAGLPASPPEPSDPAAEPAHHRRPPGDAVGINVRADDNTGQVGGYVGEMRQERNP